MIHTQINQLLNETILDYHDALCQNKDILTDHINDFNLGAGLFFVEGVLRTLFVHNYFREMNLDEYAELKTYLYKAGLQLKAIIFQSKN